MARLRIALGKPFLHQRGQQAVRGGALQPSGLGHFRRLDAVHVVFGQQPQQGQAPSQGLRSRSAGCFVHYLRF